MDEELRNIFEKNTDKKIQIMRDAEIKSRKEGREVLRKQRQNARKMKIASLIAAGVIVAGFSIGVSASLNPEAKYVNDNIKQYEYSLGVNGDQVHQFEQGVGRDLNTKELLVDYKPVHLANELVESSSREEALCILAAAMNIVNEGYEEYVMAGLDIAAQREDAPDYLKGGLLSLTGCDNYEDAKNTVRKTAIELYKENGIDIEKGGRS